MANTYKNIIITPNRDTAANVVPTIQFSGGDNTTNTDINLRVYATQSGTLSFEGSAGQLFSITNDLTNTIFSVSDISGIPSLEIDANGKITLAQFGGNVGIGTANVLHKLDVAGGANISSYLIVNGTNVIATLSGSNTAVGAGANTVGSAAFDKANSTLYTSNVVIAVTDNSNSALRITQLGSGNAILVEDSANPDSTPFVIDSTGRVGIGNTSPTSLLDVRGTARFNTIDYNSIGAVFGQRFIKINELTDILHRADRRFTVTGGHSSLFDGSFESSYTLGASTNNVININVAGQSGVPVSGITYGEGSIFLSFYYTDNAYVDASVRVKQNGVWSNASPPVNVATSNLYKVMEFGLPGGNYLTDIELSISTDSANSVKPAALNFISTRLTTETELPFVSKYQTSNYVFGNYGVKHDNGSINSLLTGTGDSYFANIAGNIGIGITAPTSKLHVAGTANITTSLILGTINVSPAIAAAYDKANSANILAFNTGVGANAFSAATIAGANTAVGAGANAYLLATIAGANTTVGAGANTVGSAAYDKANAANVLAFNALPNTSGASFVGNLIFPTGNIAIGQSASDARLAVNGNVRIISAGSAVLSIEADTDNVTETEHPRIYLKQDGGFTVGRLGYADGTNTIELINEAQSDLKLGTNNTVKFIIDYEGNVIIGTTSSGTPYKFEVNSAINVMNIASALYVSGGNVLVGRTNSTVGQGVKLDVAGAINASAVLVNGTPVGYTLLGNIATTSGTSQTLSSLNLSSYDSIQLRWINVSGGSASVMSYNDGTADFAIGPGISAGGNNFFKAMTTIGLDTGILNSVGFRTSNSTNYLLSNTAYTASDGPRNFWGITRTSKSTTSITVKNSTGFVGGYVLVIGIS